ncbi:tRNA (mnm(5)s(2)U34)-methyltransferase, chloroplastic-like [Bidens hawaiensis]|uniref:tRNA (mnm(5)s(2)U34)-methyltransferase, chloroplastic-like n=1 Tax=Bidens hawaiensis TaxID=980011 RepID=UPI00404B98EE
MMMLRCYPVSNMFMFRFNYKHVGLCYNRLSVPFGSLNHHNHNIGFHSQPINSTNDSPLSGLEHVLMDYLFGKKKSTEVAHSIWKHVVKKGDAAVDATCGNGYDTLAMVNMVADESCNGHVYSMDIQESALQNTACLLDKSLDLNKRNMVELFATCHSKMEEVVPRGATVRLVAFNLGYLPGSDKTVITKSETTLLGMQTASRILASGGLISMLVYVGHPGGMEEYETVEGFASGLSVNEWICWKLQMMNKPLAPVLVLLCKR